MKNKIKFYIPIALLVIVVAVIVLFPDGSVVKINLFGEARDSPMPARTSNFTDEVVAAENIAMSPSVSNDADNVDVNDSIATAYDTLTVVKQGREKTFRIYKGVDESTLKKGVGWMESSAKAGEEGICILMGHRNGDFRFLNGLKEDDTLIYQTARQENYTYTVQTIEIVPSDDALRFPAIEGKNLMLITCYPFRYVGHAPQKYVVSSRIQD